MWLHVASSTSVGSPLTGTSSFDTQPCSSTTPRESATQSTRDLVETGKLVQNQTTASLNEIVADVAPQSVSANEGTSLHRLQQEKTGHAEQTASRIPASQTVPTSTQAESQSKIDKACLHLAALLEHVLKSKRLAGDYRFLVDHYRSHLRARTGQRRNHYWSKITAAFPQNHGESIQSQCPCA